MEILPFSINSTSSSLKTNYRFNNNSNIKRPITVFSTDIFRCRSSNRCSTNSTFQFRISSSSRYSYRAAADEDDDDGGAGGDFTKAVALFNEREYYKCHDVLERLWMDAEEGRRRRLLHGVLQCAVGLHHLFNHNHKGAMMELGEGLCKLRDMDFEEGEAFHEFQLQISALLNFIYRTQIELAACTDDLCVAMDQSERSYQLLGGYAAGQQLYSLRNGTNDDVTYIAFCPGENYQFGEPPMVRMIYMAMDQLERSCQLLGGYAAGQQLYCLRNCPDYDDDITYIAFCPGQNYQSGEPLNVALIDRFISIRSRAVNLSEQPRQCLKSHLSQVDVCEECSSLGAQECQG